MQQSPRVRKRRDIHGHTEPMGILVYLRSMPRDHCMLTRYREKSQKLGQDGLYILFAVDEFDDDVRIFFGKMSGKMFRAIHGTMLTACASE